MLRRSLWAVLVALFAASLAVPQASAQGIKLGVKGGVNIADIGGKDADSLGSTKTKLGFVAGVFAEFMIGDMFAIQPEVLYSQKGIKEDVATGPAAKFKLDYVEVPVLFKVNIPIEGSKVRPSVYAGPAVAFKASCKVSGSSGGVDANVNCDDPSIDVPVKSMDYGVAFGGGIAFDVGGAEVGVDVRYTLGLSKVSDDPDPFDIKNRVISITGTVGFSPNK